MTITAHLYLIERLPRKEICGRVNRCRKTVENSLRASGITKAAETQVLVNCVVRKGMSCADAAVLFGITTSAVYKRLRGARRG